MSIYLDNAATTPLSQEVLEAMLPYMTEHYGNASSIHALGRRARAAIEQARRTIAQTLQASIGEIFFTSGGTEASNLALKGAINNLGIQRIITSPLEHHCVLHTVESLAKNQQVQCHFVRLMANGHINLTDLEKLLSHNNVPTLVSLMHVNNEIGNLLDVETVSELCQKYGALLHSDTVQSYGYYPINVEKTKYSFLTGSAHKLHGPKGIGFIYINSNNIIHPQMLGGSQERNMRAGTENVYGIVGLGKAAEIAYQNLPIQQKHLSGLKQYLVQQLLEHIPNVRFNGDYAGRSSDKVLNVSFPSDSAANLLLLHLDIAGICASGGSACSSGVDVGSHVLRALKTETDRTNIRFSFSKYNTKTELDVLIQKLKKIFKLT